MPLPQKAPRQAAGLNGPGCSMRLGANGDMRGPTQRLDLEYRAPGARSRSLRSPVWPLAKIADPRRQDCTMGQADPCPGAVGRRHHQYDAPTYAGTAGQPRGFVHDARGSQFHPLPAGIRSGSRFRRRSARCAFTTLAQTFGGSSRDVLSSVWCGCADKRRKFRRHLSALFWGPGVGASVTTGARCRSGKRQNFCLDGIDAGGVRRFESRAFQLSDRRRDIALTLVRRNSQKIIWLRRLAAAFTTESSRRSRGAEPQPSGVFVARGSMHGHLTQSSGVKTVLRQ